VPQQLAQKIPALLDSDLEKNNLVLSSSCDGKGLFTQKSIPEGEVILGATALLFTEKAKMMEVIRLHEEHQDACIKITGVIMEGKPTTLLLSLIDSMIFNELAPQSIEFISTLFINNHSYYISAILSDAFFG
jgi:hypothetical protein